MPQAETSLLSISLVIPTKDRADDLAQTLKCVLSQTRPPDELIVVDQSRAGDAREALAECADLRPVHVSDPEIRGLPAARNVGFAASTGDLVCFLDDDVTLDPHYLAELELGLAPGCRLSPLSRAAIRAHAAALIRHSRPAGPRDRRPLLRTDIYRGLVGAARRSPFITGTAGNGSPSDTGWQNKIRLGDEKERRGQAALPDLSTVGLE